MLRGKEQVGGGDAGTNRVCDGPDCEAVGLFRAPKARDRLDDYYWFCREHAREYNARWDYFSGMSGEQIDAARQESVTGERPTWKMGMNRGRHWLGGSEKDFFGLFSGNGSRRPDPRDRKRPLPAGILDALATLGVTESATPSEVKQRSRALAKRFHPDATGGNTASEDRLKRINQAYSALKLGGYLETQDHERDVS